VKGRVLVWPVVTLLALALVGQTVRWRDRLTAGRLLREVEALTMAAMSTRQLTEPLLFRNLEVLRTAAPKDPVEVGIPIATGTQYLLLRRNDAAIRAYEKAVALEPRPEGYLNLGRSQLAAGRREEARANFQRAVRLDPRLISEIPEGAL
jgi:tetratricopeptide (TPR) repeat protein